MTPRFHHRSARGLTHSPGWRRVGAALAAFALGVQLVVSGVVIRGIGVAADQTNGWVVCTHDAADQTGSGKPPPAKSQDECPACTFAQTAKLAPPLPAAPVLAALHGRSELMPVRPAVLGLARHSPPPYSSRAPPFFA
ncbi:MAG: hypothetical protein J2P47_14520 [Acetobacteraceae bacterium]|nr:hypothetical protein [Acetobacteraceae bacterium]